MKQGRRAGPAALALLLLLAWVPACTPAAGVAPDAERVTLTLLATTDMHGNIWPYDYLRAQAVERGLAKVSSYVKQVRARQPNTLLVDCGDTFQGTPIAWLYARKHPQRPNPMVAAMNAVGFDAMAVGNHEFNFGLPTLWRLKDEAEFPILGANVVSTYHDSLRDFAPYIIREVGGVRVALLGMVTPGPPRWEPPEHLVGYEFRELVETAREWVPKLRKKADLVILIIHSGLGRDPETGEPDSSRSDGENAVWDVAEQVGGFDAIFFGHSHRELAGKVVNDVLLVQARNWARSVAEVDFVLERDAASGWRLAERRSRLVPMDESIPADEEILDLTRAAHVRTERYLGTVIAQLDDELDGRTGRIEDHPLVELIHRAQLQYGRADVSLAALFSTRTRWPAGPVTIRDVYGLYFYENKLFTVEITGAQLKEALEWSARSYNTWPWQGSPFSSVAGFNYDMADGVRYRVDLSKPVGERIVDLTFEGQPLARERKLRLALNSYRWAGGGRYQMLRHAKIVQRPEGEVRELIIDYLRERGKVNTSVDYNWWIIPADADTALREFLGAPATPAATSSSR